MTSGLRKAHKIIWMVLALLGAVLIVLSINSVKQPLGIDSDASIATTTEGVHTIEDTTQFHISIEELATTNKLHIVLKKPLKSASTSVYVVTPDQKKGAFLGTIDKKGLYAFDIDKTIKKIQLYDGIKNSEIQNIALSWE